MPLPKPSASFGRAIGGLIAGATAMLLAAASPGLAQDGKLIIYTSQPNTDAQATLDAFRKRYPKVDASFVRDGTTKIMAKLRAEMAAGGTQADVLLIADSVTMEGLKKEGRLLAHTAADVSAYPAGIHDSDKTWFATKLITTGIVHHAKAPFVPKSWADLTRPEAKGQISMASPLVSGAALIHATTLVAALPGGWDYYKQLKANGAIAAGGNGGVLKAVASGEKMFGVIVDFMPIREQAKGAPVAFVFPTEGVSAVSEPAAILKATRNPSAAKAFIDFLLSKEGQQLALSQGYLAAHPEVPVPAGFPSRSSIKLMNFDAGRAFASADADKRAFVEIFTK